MENKSFGERLVAAGQQYGRLCVGIDPHDHLLDSWGLSDDIDGLRSFSETCVKAFSGNVALVKPQVAFYERFGSHGFGVLEETIQALRESGVLVVSDAKRGDIGSTMAGYASAWLGQGSPLESDAVTVAPYLGVGALKPAFEASAQTGKGIFVLAATSNPEAVKLQSSHDESGRTVAQAVVDECATFNAASASAVGSIGVVVGATVNDAPKLGSLNGPVLMPGVGAQGASMADADSLVGEQTHLAFPNVSRAVLRSGPDPEKMQESIASLLKR